MLAGFGPGCNRWKGAVGQLAAQAVDGGRAPVRELWFWLTTLILTAVVVAASWAILIVMLRL